MTLADVLARIDDTAERHSAASWWLSEGVDIQTVSTLLGHTDPRVTMALYLHVSEDLKRDAVERMQRSLPTPLPTPRTG